jgi:phospholipid/cholesterol/gamma-HCH transport system permease protein
MPDAGETSPAGFFSDFFKRRIFGLQDYSILVYHALIDMFTPPYYWADVLEQMDVIGVGSLPIVILTSFFMGAVMVLQTEGEFSRFGAQPLTADAVALALVRELGPAITGLLIAGRNGSGIASEIGSMVVTEQVDAMRALGTDPVRKLVTPRVLATVLTLPLLTLVADFTGLVGGFIMAFVQLHLTASEYWNRAIKALAFGDLMQGLVKPLVFGLLVATVSCYYGLRVRGGTEGVGRATTTAVVVSSVAILIVDFFITHVMLFLFPS